MTDTKRLAQMLRKGSIAIGVMAYPKEAEEAADRIEAQAALIKELVEALEHQLAYDTMGTSDDYGNAVRLIAKAKAVQPKLNLAGIHGQHENLGDF
jgi:uncharacterized pyridoxal phosphate-containing UPF0001 family protein